MSLVLPAPVNVPTDEVLPAGSSNGAAAEEESSLLESEKLKRNIIFPPPEIRTLIDKTASALHKSANPTQLETKIREGQRTDPKFSFLNSQDPYHTYYLFMQARLREGNTEDGSAPLVDGETGNGQRQDGSNAGLISNGNEGLEVDKGKPKEPRELEFVVERPSLPAVDLDILKLTALFTARRGRAFLASLSTREGRNYQFDFLRPTHSLYPLFNRMVQQYTLVLVPPKEALDKIELESESKAGRKISLLQARERAEWEKWRSERARKREDAKEAQRIEFAQVDWQDFVVVENIEFTAEDDAIQLEPPTSIAKLDSLTLAQKMMASTLGEQLLLPGQQEEEEAPEEEMDMDESDDEESEQAIEAKKKAAEAERAKEVQRKFAEQQGAMKIRKDYVPKARQPVAAPQTVMYRGQAIPIDEMTEHLRIELLDPSWKERKTELDARKTQASLVQQGADVSASLRELARSRTDMFGTDQDEETRKLQEDEERARRREKEKVIWDGHTSSKAATLDKFQHSSNLDDQIAAIHKAAGLNKVEGAAGPAPAMPPPNVVGPAAPTPSTLPPPPAFLPPMPTGVISAPPTGPKAMMTPASGYPSMPPPPGQYSSAPVPASASGPSGAPPSIHPSRLAALAARDAGEEQPLMATGGGSPFPPPPPSAPQQGRPREEDDGEAGPDAKRVKTIEKLADGMYHPESDWLASHPATYSISILLPSDVPSKPELDGSLISLPPLSLRTTIGELRAVIQEQIKTTVPLSKMRLELGEEGGKRVLNNKSSLAELNLAEGDRLVLGLRK